MNSRRRDQRALDRAEYLLFVAATRDGDKDADDLWYRLLQWRRQHGDTRVFRPYRSKAGS